jgi:hypothetical protein
VQDEIKQQHMKTKDMTLKGKLDYFWYYYKVHTIVAIIVVIIGIVWIHNIVTAKDYNFYGIMLNSSHLDGDALEASFGDYAGLDMETYDCFIDTLSTLSYQAQSEYEIATFQKLVALVQSKELDVMVLDSQVFYNFSFNGMLMDLREAFTDEELAAYEGRIYYIDNALIKEAEAAEEDTSASSYDAVTSSASDEEIAAEAETHRHPETMTEPIPVGIFADDSAFVTKTDAYPTLVPIYGISVTTQRLEPAKAYLGFMFDDSIEFENMVSVY